MHQYEQKRQQKQNFWNESGAVLHETDNRQSFAGNAAGTFVVRENSADREAGSAAAAQRAFRKLKGMENAYGSVWFGMTEEKQLKIEVSRKTACRENGLRTDQKKLEESRTAELYAGSGGRVGELRGRTDSHQKADSAVILQASDRLTPERILRDLRRLAQSSGQETLYQLLPGLWEQEAPELRKDNSRSALHREHLKKVRKHIEDVLEEIRAEKEQPRRAAVFAVPGFSAQQAAEETENKTGQETESGGEEKNEDENKDEKSY